MRTMISTLTACALSLALGMPAFAETPAPASVPASVAPVKSDSAKATPTKSVKKHRKHAKSPNTVPAAAPASH